jgi:type II secretory pathway predicted ATPase ExeA
MTAAAVATIAPVSDIRSPFRNTLDTRFFYNTPQHEEGIARIRLAIEDSRGMALIQGLPGTGKTMISQVVFERIQQDRYTVAFLAEPDKRATGTVFLRTLLSELGVEPKPLLYVLKQQFRELAVRRWNEGRRLILVLDEAHLYNTNALETIRVLLNVETTTEKLLTIILLAQPEIQSHLKRMPQLDQRIDFRLVLSPLSDSQVKGYIQHRLKVSGSTVRFTEAAIHRISQEARIPRQINLICDHALLVRAGNGKSADIGVAVVDHAIRAWKGEE